MKQSVILVPFGGWLLCKSLILRFKLDPNYKLIIANSAYVTLSAKVDHSNHYVYQKQLVYVGVGKSTCTVKHFDSWKFMLIKPLNVKPDESYEEVSAP